MYSATQTKNFLSSFRLSAEGWEEEPDKEMQGSFWVCPHESASAAEALSSASGAYEKVSSHHARGACEVSQGFCKNRFERSTIVTPESNRAAFQRPTDAPREARRRGKLANRALCARGGGSEKIQIRKLFGGGFFGGKCKTQDSKRGVLAPPTRARTTLSVPRRF